MGPDVGCSQHSPSQQARRHLSRPLALVVSVAVLVGSQSVRTLPFDALLCCACRIWSHNSSCGAIPHMIRVPCPPFIDPELLCLYPLDL